MKRRELKPGDIVRVNGYDNLRIQRLCEKAKVKSISGCKRWVTLELFDIAASFPIIHVHRNQCTPIRIVKKKRREWWINQTFFNLMHIEYLEKYRRTTPPDNLDGWIHLKECKLKK